MHIKMKWEVPPRHAIPASGIGNSKPCICSSADPGVDAWEARARLMVVGYDPAAAPKDLLTGEPAKMYIYQRVQQTNICIDSIRKSCKKVTMYFEDIFALDASGVAKDPDDHFSYHGPFGSLCPNFCLMESNVIVFAKLVTLWSSGASMASAPGGMTSLTRQTGITVGSQDPADNQNHPPVWANSSFPNVSIKDVGGVRTTWYFHPIVNHCAPWLGPGAPPGGEPTCTPGHEPPPSPGMGPSTPGGAPGGSVLTPSGDLTTRYGGYNAWGVDGQKERTDIPIAPPWWPSALE